MPSESILPRFRFRRRPVSLLLSALLFSSAVSSAALPVSEFEVKAAFLLNILKLTERKTRPSTSDLILCLVAAGPMEEPLRSLEGTLIRGRKLRIQNVSKADFTQCEVLFLGRTAGQESALAKASALGVLTIGQDHDFLTRGGLVALLVQNRRVIVEVNRLAIDGGQWRFSSHLLEIAHVSNGGVR